ncbi:MAG TPA: ATP-binding cassette domain-containing protein [Pyrinomonadaceae bacterium]|nr:ATP-binding cassette domain-containing protein [Pyrinomonadaceae bacterium]
MGIFLNVKKRLGQAPRPTFDLDVSFSGGDDIIILGGPSGAGKTTTLRLIAGILTPDEGTITVGKRTYFDSQRKVNLSMQERRVGYVFQDYALFPHLSAAENIEYGIRNNDKRARWEKARDLLSLFRITHAGDRRPHQISGGEQQRVALARALASEPEILLLDEPLSAVDVETRAALLDEIETIQREVKIPVVYVTHNQSEAERLAMHQVILRSGRVELNIRDGHAPPNVC